MAKKKRATAAFPAAIEPLKPALVRSPPEGVQWLHEVKYDGYRMVCFLNDGQVKLQTKNQHDWTKRFPELVEAARSLPATSVILDSEMCALRPDGVSSMSELHAALTSKQTHRLVLFIFDLLYLDGQDLRSRPLIERKMLLAKLLKRVKSSRLQYVEHFVGDGSLFYSQCQQMGLEGIVSKLSDSKYVSGRSELWLKTKCDQVQDFVIGGLERPKGSQIGVDSFLLGEVQEAGELVYVGSVSAGISTALLRKWGKTLTELEQLNCPFSKASTLGSKRAVWLRPELRARVRYLEVTDDGKLRHASLLGIAECKD